MDTYTLRKVPGFKPAPPKPFSIALAMAESPTTPILYWATLVALLAIKTDESPSGGVKALLKEAAPGVSSADRRGIIAGALAAAVTPPAQVKDPQVRLASIWATGLVESILSIMRGNGENHKDSSILKVAAQIVLKAA